MRSRVSSGSLASTMTGKLAPATDKAMLYVTGLLYGAPDRSIIDHESRLEY